MKKIFALIVFVMMYCCVAAQVTIAIQDFETVPQAPVLTYTAYQGTPTFASGTSTASDSPPNSPFGIGTSSAWETTQQSAGVILEFANISTVGYTDVYIIYRVAAFSMGSAGNGPDALDHVTPSVSVDGGTTWYTRKKITGNSNNSWEYAALATATDTFAAANTTVSYMPAGTGLATTDGYSMAVIYIPNAYTQVRLRIHSRESTAQERWCIDNVEVKGTPVNQVPTAIINAGALSVCEGKCIIFTDQSTGNPTSWSWIFSGGIPASSSQQNPGSVCYLTQGTYNVTLIVSNASGSDTAVQAITVNPVPSVGVTSTIPLCAGDSVWLTASASGGTPGYQWAWSNNLSTTANAVITSGGNYTVTVSDANICTATASITVFYPPPLVVTNTVTPASCASCCDGSTTPVVTGGTPPYSYTLSCGPSTTLCPGTYICCVVDANGCNSCDTVMITYPTGIENVSWVAASFYPNPASNELRIKNSEFEVGLVEIYNVLGKKLHSYQPETGNLKPGIRIDVSFLSPGIYFLKLKGEGMERTTRFLKQ